METMQTWGRTKRVRHRTRATVNRQPIADRQLADALAGGGEHGIAKRRCDRRVHIYFFKCFEKNSMVRCHASSAATALCFRYGRFFESTVSLANACFAWYRWNSNVTLASRSLFSSA